MVGAGRINDIGTGCAFSAQMGGVEVGDSRMHGRGHKWSIDEEQGSDGSGHWERSRRGSESSLFSLRAQ
jgi:hypothetical protein